jgi:hypothetical protein
MFETERWQPGAVAAAALVRLWAVYAGAGLGSAAALFEKWLREI